MCIYRQKKSSWKPHLIYFHLLGALNLPFVIKLALKLLKITLWIDIRQRGEGWCQKKHNKYNASSVIPPSGANIRLWFVGKKSEFLLHKRKFYPQDVIRKIAHLVQDNQRELDGILLFYSDYIGSQISGTVGAPKKRHTWYVPNVFCVLDTFCTSKNWLWLKWVIKCASFINRVLLPCLNLTVLIHLPHCIEKKVHEKTAPYFCFTGLLNVLWRDFGNLSTVRFELQGDFGQDFFSPRNILGHTTQHNENITVMNNRVHINTQYCFTRTTPF